MSTKFIFTEGMSSIARGDEAWRIVGIGDTAIRESEAKEYIESYARFILENGFGEKTVGNLEQARKLAIGSTWDAMCYVDGNNDISQAAKDLFCITPEIKAYARLPSSTEKHRVATGRF